MFLGKTLYSHGASLHPGVPCDELASHPGGSRNIPSPSCHGNRDKLRPDGPLGSYADFTFTLPTVFLSSYRNTSGFLGEREMPWEHEPQASVSTAF